MNILDCIEKWDFDFIYKHSDLFDINAYIDFLYNIGDFDNLIEGICDKNLNDNLNFNLKNIIALRSNIVDFEQDDCFLKNLVNLSRQELCYIFLYFMKHNTLSIQKCFILLDFYLKKDFDRLSFSFIIKNVVNYFIQNDRSFFSKQNKNLLLIIHYLSNKFNSEISREYLSIITNLMHRHFNLKKKNLNGKIALCIFGALRGNYKETLQSIINSLAKSCDADVFIFSWDRKFLWMGCGGNGYWVDRVFPKEISTKCPKIINSTSNFYNILPHTFDKLSQEYFDFIHEDISIISNRIKIVKLESQKDFEIKYQTTKNSAKYWYSMYRSLELLLKYENQNMFKYDYIIGARSDKEFNGLFERSKLYDLSNNEIYDYFGGYGPAGEFFAGDRDNIVKWMSLWEISQNNNDFNSLRNDFSQSTHFTYYNICAFCNIIVKNPYDSNFYQKPFNEAKCVKGFKIPEFQNELNADLNLLHEQIPLEDILSIQSFFKFLKSNYGIIEERLIYNAENSLSYKIGKCISRMSISLLLFSPIVIFYIFLKHKLCCFVFTSVSKKDKDIYKSYFFKLGKLLLNSFKNWYKGGLFKLWVNIAKLKKEYKKDLKKD
ncbi:hypothetical protein [Campylobacter molothri]|uniref:hypothetical protein n=1 Tax=Campylobacter molothri TaxID=1032242 RepID=UPI003DA1059E